MGINVLSLVSFTLLVAFPISSPTPAPVPGSDFVNLTQLLSVAGPFSTFLSYLEKTKVIETFQNQVNNTGEGITIFVPKNSAFISQKNPSLANLTRDQLKQLCLFHALPHYYSLADFKNLSLVSPISTFAGAALTFIDDFGTVRISSGCTKTNVSSSVLSTDPVAVYQVDNVLLPEAIFGTDIPPAAAPAPAPDSPAAGSPSNSSFKRGVMSQLGLAISGMIMFFCKSKERKDFPSAVVKNRGPLNTMSVTFYGCNEIVILMEDWY